jgi:hypothetical protein
VIWYSSFIVKRLGIIQPGKIGDIVICLPIANFYHKKGYEIIWPVDRNIINNFIGYVDYVKFVPCEFHCFDAHKTCYAYNCNSIIDLAFTIPYANIFNSNNYLYNQSSYSFDEFKYHIANVPFEEKWNLEITRNHKREQELFDTINVHPYSLCQLSSSDYRRDIKLEDYYDIQHCIPITNKTNSIFDWLYALEDARKHILIESCFSNLVDQLNIKVNEQILCLKHGYYGNL